MKKFLPLFLTTLLLLSVACAEEVTLPTFAWECSGTDHWQLDTTGTIINMGPHDTGDSWLCSVCGCEVLDWGDGAVDVSQYDAYGNLLRCVSFAGEEKTNEIIHILTYNEDDIVLKDAEYINGQLYSETVYTVNAAGEQVPVTQTAWDEDGATSISEYDEHGNCIRSVSLSAEGAVLFETISEYALNDFGWYYECKTTSRFDTGDTFYREINQYGDTLRSLNTYADGTVWGDWTYEYKYQSGSKVWSKQYSFGQLSREEYYDADDCLVQEIEYLEDGGKTIYLYNAQGDMTTATTYAADGSIASETIYEYVYDDWMTQLEIHVYTDGVLTEDTIFHHDEEVGFTGYRETSYNSDGTRTVTEYNDYLEPIRVIVYAADGSVISDAAAAAAY